VSGLGAIYRREMLSLWVTPLAWVLLCVFLLLQGGIFYGIVVHFAATTGNASDVGPLQAYFGQESILLAFSLLLLCPALSMKSFAEERRSGTLETLLTAPVSANTVVLGKYLATLSTYAAIWAPTALYVAILRKTESVDPGTVLSSYLGILGIGAGFLAIGTLMSALTQSQLLALMLTIFIEFGLFVLGIGEYVFDPGPLWELCSYVSIASQMDELSRGIVDSRRLVFDLSLVVFPLFVCGRVVDSWRTDA
jgi:ABC-2 type transport system permease protein